MNNYFIITLLFISVYEKAYSYNYEEDVMCHKDQTSCSIKFGQQYNLDFCKQFIYDKFNTAECKALYKDDDTTINKNTDLGKLTLTPYLDIIRTVMNVTFTDVKFKKLRIYFQRRKDLASERNCTVREFNLNGILPPNASFSYTCPWSNRLGGSDLEFNYDYGVDQYETRKRFVFTVPSFTKLQYKLDDTKKIYFFPYIDYTDLGNLILHIHPADDKFNVTKYKVDFMYSYKNQTNVIKTYNLTAVSSTADISKSFETSGAGEYYFLIEPISDYCQLNKNVCVVEKTASIHIEPVSSLLIGMVGVSLLIPIFLIIVYMFTKHWPGMLKSKANVLLVTVPTNNAHDTVAPAFSKFLQETFNINVMLDIDELPRDSFDWLKTAIHKYATHIIFLRSDDELSSNRVIYQDTYLETIRLLKPSINPKKINECIISFRYSSPTTDISHPELVHLLKKFNFDFHRDFSKIMKFMINKKVTLRNVINNETYQNLLEAVRGVENERTVRRNQRNFEIVPALGDINDDYVYPRKDVENNEHINEEQVMIELDPDIDLLGGQNEELADNNEIFNDDSDLDEFNLFGNV